MIRIAVVDYSAESRGEIINRLNSFLSDAGSNLLLLPRISFKPICPQELRFNAAADLLIVGCEFIARDLSEITRIKKLFPNTPLVAWLNQEQSNLNIIEQVARQGADDVLTFDLTPDYFFRRLLMLVRKAVHQSNGKLLVIDGGKGGVGVTTLAAALAELMVSYGKKVVVIDLDFETQDLSRFLQARPFINENLQLLLDDERPVTEETVNQCLNSIWQDDNSFRCMPPISESDELYDPRSNLPRIFLSIIEVLDSTNDLVIVDMGCARSALQKMFYRIADKLLFVVNDDPASLYASIDKLSRARSFLGAGAQLCVVQNSAGLSGLGNKLLRKEFSRIAKLQDKDWAVEQINFCKIGQRWPGSGSTFLSQAKAQIARQIENLAFTLDILEVAVPPGIFKDILKKFRKISNQANQQNIDKLMEVAQNDLIGQKNRPQIAITGNINGITPSKINPSDQILLKEESELDSLISRPRQLAFVDSLAFKGRNTGAGSI